ncbi:hypothetical protein [Modestobacter sp. VKM Ac-2985]|uniref:hypothetical protein n=1 Tax=Modestobacter sp. VKM Ac-2985 TaxID=3004139 RepID=UPI0022AB7E21|nr:hypothetical protein [Modestobacter sp. VKM Ac-2985]MCZ2837158.1 hypothetical protein [Modestobacter sp. VKM Ac-2985]
MVCGDCRLGDHATCAGESPSFYCPCTHPTPPADAPEQQDGERHPGLVTREDHAVAMGLVRKARAASSDEEVDAARDAIAQDIADERALAARRPTEAEQLRDALRVHHPVMRSETGPFSGCRCKGVRLGEDVIAHVVGHLRAALDGAQPDPGPQCPSYSNGVDGWRCEHRVHGDEVKHRNGEMTW